MEHSHKAQCGEIRFLVGLQMRTARIIHHLTWVHQGHAFSKSAVYRWAKRFRGETWAPTTCLGQEDHLCFQMESLHRSRGPWGFPPTSACALWQLHVEFQLVLCTLLWEKNFISARDPVTGPPHFLTDVQKRHCLLLSRHNLRMIQRDPAVLTGLVTGDESWFLVYDPSQRRSSMQWMAQNAPHPAKVRRDQRVVKAMLVLFFDVRGVVSRQFVPRGQGVDHHEYLRHLQLLKQNMRRRRRPLWQCRNWILQHDRAPAHRADIVQRFIMQNDIELLPHPGYSPDLAPCDFFVFNRIKWCLRGTRFADINALKRAVDREIRSIPVTEFTHAIMDLLRRYQACIDAGGDYFEWHLHRPEHAVTQWKIDWKFASDRITQKLDCVEGSGGPWSEGAEQSAFH